LEQLTHSYYPEFTSKIVRIPNPVSLPCDFPVHREKEDSKYHVLFLGYLQNLKGINDLLQVEERTRQKHPDWIFDIAGKGELQQLVESRAAEFPDRIQYYGWANASLREQLYRKCDVYFLPSYIEGMPLGILEAMSYGVPVVSTNVGGIPDIIGEQQNIGILS